MISHELVEELTRQYGGEWGINHSRRLLRIIDLIGDALKYDRETVWLAAHLHDWGAYPPWAQDGVDHAVRSRQVAEPFLLEQGLPPEMIGPVLDCIESHHRGDPDRPIESILLSDADALDFLGVTGVLRDFSKNPRNLRTAYSVSRGRMEKLPKAIILESSKALMKLKLERMARLLAEFQEETAGLF